MQVARGQHPSAALPRRRRRWQASYGVFVCGFGTFLRAMPPRGTDSGIDQGHATKRDGFGHRSGACHQEGQMRG